MDGKGKASYKKTAYCAMIPLAVGESVLVTTATSILELTWFEAAPGDERGRH